MTLMPWPCASSVMAMMFCWIISNVCGPLLRAMSLVPARINDGGRLERDHIRIETHEHLRRGLAADAAIDVRLAGKRVSRRPTIGNRIAHEHDPAGIDGLLHQLAIRLVVAAQLVPVLELIGQRRGGIRKQQLAAAG